jgi:hypothetical protein
MGHGTRIESAREEFGQKMKQCGAKTARKKIARVEKNKNIFALCWQVRRELCYLFLQ